ncbi:hypothetical protein C8R32_1132 [Nitrosospira sp. Nsp5]|uniref:Uncharacterized protein n=1 Tax=Nitrosospira multiformis TaxID=1231 RepID=A0ABY0THY0_9PROT|nr:hypothetical protein C8R32_1132 [Nitrosospira sp. Nsp5]SDQ86398.1 hypothetical protein SAMN05216402_2595 [Nitrosospira multiformis]
MIHRDFVHHFTFIVRVSLLADELLGSYGTWPCSNPLEWNDHSASLRLAPGTERTRILHPVQLPDLGWKE